MKLLTECRTTEVKQGDTWVPAQWEQIEEGDIIRMFEPASSNGVLVPVIFEGKYVEGHVMEKPVLYLENPETVASRMEAPLPAQDGDE